MIFPPYLNNAVTLLIFLKGGANMDAQRAQEISDAPVMINVTYNGNPVYIEHVDQSNQTATIHPLNNPNKKQSVSVTALKEN